MTTRPTKAQRKLSEIDFSKQGAHIALCHKDQGAANGHNYALVIKANKYSPEFIEKVQQVRVTMELPEFLQRFFGMWYEDAELLAKFFGYVEPEDDVDTPDDAYENYLMTKLESYEILKGLHDAESIPLAMANLDESEYLAVVTDQARLEKAMASVEKAKASSATVAEKESVEAKAKTTDNKKSEASVSSITKTTNKEAMTQDVKLETEAELILKAQYTELQKSLLEQQELLKKNQEEFENYKKEQVVKAKMQAITAVVKDKTHALAISKAGLALSEQDFDEFVTAIGAIVGVADTSALFVEKGLTVPEVSDTEAKKESKLAQAIKKQQNLK